LLYILRQVISGFTMVKETKGSHKYSVSFALIDQSRPSPATAVFLIWFCNTVDGLHMKFKVGDILRIEKARVQQFNGFPQLVAKDSNASVAIFHRVEDSITGAPTCPLSPLPVVNTAVDADGAPTGSAANRAPFVDEAWETTSFGVFDTNSGRISKAAKKGMLPSSADRPPLLWPEEVAKLYSTHAWARTYFRNHSFSEAESGVYNSSLHSLQTFIHQAHKSPLYAQMQPVVEVGHVQPHGTDGQRSILMQSGKCDVVCLVTSVARPSDANDHKAGMTIWDGTTNGLYTVASSCLQAVQVALDAPPAYDASVAAGADEAAERAQQTALYLKEVHPRRLLGSAVRVVAEDSKYNAHIGRCRPGMWIRIRNLHAVLDRSGGSTVRADSHICQLGADFA
jgi:hypothetical protein